MYEEFTSITEQEAPLYLKDLENEKVRYRMKEIVGNNNVLDCGCGRGIDAKLYRPEQYVGVDVSPYLVYEASKANPNYRFYDQKIDDYIDSQFCLLDYIICHSVLEHQPSEQQALYLFKKMVYNSRCVLIAWHMIPGDKTEIMQVKGHFGKTVYQNYYDKKLFELPNISIKKERVDNYELWIVTKI